MAQDVRTKELICPHPEWTPDDLVQRASELVPILRSRLDDCERLGRIPESTNDEFVKEGFYRVLQPRVFGGYEFSLRDFVRMIVEISRGCPSSGWVLSLTSGHAIMLSAFFSEKAQEHAYGADGDFRGPSSTTPHVGAVGEKVAGGYRISGEWNYASGIDVSTHFFGGTFVATGEHEEPEPRLVLFDRADYTIVDNWNVMGMAGTGSRQVVVTDVFVLEERAIAPPRDAFNARHAPGRAVHANPIYSSGRLGSVLLEEMAAVAVGTAKGMLDAFEDEISLKPQRVVGRGLVPGTSRAESPAFQRHYGEAWALIHMAEATVLKVAEDYVEYACEDAAGIAVFSDEREQQLLVLEQYATKLAVDAVELLFRTGGTSTAMRGSVLQRYFRDMSVLSTHAGAQYERGAEMLGNVHFTNLATKTEPVGEKI